MDNMRERLIVRIMVFMMGLFTTAYVYAADETVTMKVGEKKHFICLRVLRLKHRELLVGCLQDLMKYK